MYTHRKQAKTGSNMCACVHAWWTRTYTHKINKYIAKFASKIF